MAPLSRPDRRLSTRPDPMAEKTEPTPLARALGRVPTGLYIVSTLDGDQPMGFVGSFVTQVGIDPPTVCVAVGHDRAPLAAIRASERFALSILDGPSAGLMGTFFKPAPEGGTPFDALATESTPAGLPVLSEALAWLECRVSGEHAVGDHVVVFGTVEAGALLRDGEPSIHLRKTGLGY